jgi:hypothetical protein
MDGARAAFDTAVDPDPEAPRPVHHGPVHHGNRPKSDRSRTPAGPVTARTAPPQVFRLVIRDRFGSKEDHPSLKVLNGPGRRAGSPGSCRRIDTTQAYARRNKRSGRSPWDAGERLLRFIYAEAGLRAHLLRIARALGSGTASVTVPGSIDVRSTTIPPRACFRPRQGPGGAHRSRPRGADRMIPA